MPDRSNATYFSRHRRWLIPLILFSLSFAVRLVHLVQVQSMPTFDFPVMDEKYHVELSSRINSENGYGAEPFYRAPLYPYLFAFLHKITGWSLFWPRFIQVVLGSLLPVLIFLFGRKLFGDRVALWAGAVAVVYPTFLYYDISLLITSLMILLTLLLTWQLYRCQERAGPVNFLIAGAMLGLAGLARPNILVLGPALVIWIWFNIRPLTGLKKAITGYVIIGLAAFIVILPVTVRNYVEGNDRVIIAWQGGFNFYLGNNRLASGWSATVPGIDFTWEGGYREAIAIAEQTTGKELKPSEVSSFWYDRAFEEIDRDPGAFVALMVKKLRLFFNGYEIPNNQDMYFVGNFSSVLKLLMFAGPVFFPFGIVAPLALLGIVFSLGQWRKYLLLYLVLAAYVVTLLLFFVCARFRQPLMPILILFAVFGAYSIYRQLADRKWKILIPSILVLALLMVESNHDMLHLDRTRLDAENRLNMGMAYLEQDQLSEAFAEFRRSVLIDSTFASGYNNLGIVATRRGNLAEACEHFRKAVRFEPFAPDRYANLATCLAERGDIASAVQVMERAVQAIPNHPAVLYKLGMTYAEAGRVEDARRAMEGSLRLDPYNIEVQQMYRRLGGSQR